MGKMTTKKEIKTDKGTKAQEEKTETFQDFTQVVGKGKNAKLLPRGAKADCIDTLNTAIEAIDTHGKTMWDQSVIIIETLGAMREPFPPGSNTEFSKYLTYAEKHLGLAPIDKDTRANAIKLFQWSKDDGFGCDTLQGKVDVGDFYTMRLEIAPTSYRIRPVYRALNKLKNGSTSGATKTPIEKYKEALARVKTADLLQFFTVTLNEVRDRSSISYGAVQSGPDVTFIQADTVHDYIRGLKVTMEKVSAHSVNVKKPNKNVQLRKKEIEAEVDAEIDKEAVVS